MLINSLAFAVILSGSTWAVLWPGFRDGIVMKLGFIFLAFASFTGFAHLVLYGSCPDNSQTLLNIGFAVVVTAMCARRYWRPVWKAHQTYARH